MTTATATATTLPVDPTPRGGTLVLGPVLATARPGLGAIRPANVAQLKSIAVLSRPNQRANSVVDFSDNGRYLLEVGAQTRIVDVVNGMTETTISGPGGGRAFTPDGRYVLLEEGDGNLAFWDRTTKTVARQHFGGGATVELAFSRDGRQLAAVRRDARLNVWDLEDGRLRLDQLVTDHGDRFLTAIRPGREQVAAVENAFRTRSSVRLVDWRDGHTTPNWNFTSAGFTLVDLSWRPDGALLAGLEWDTGSGPAEEHRVRYLAMQDDGSRYVDRPDALQTGPHAWSPDGRWLAIVELRRPDYHPVVTLWDGSGGFTDLVGAGNGDPTSLSWNADGSLLAVGYHNGRSQRDEVLLWDTGRRSVGATILDRYGPQFSPGGQRLVVTDSDNRNLIILAPPDEPQHLWLPFTIRP